MLITMVISLIPQYLQSVPNLIGSPVMVDVAT